MAFTWRGLLGTKPKNELLLQEYIHEKFIAPAERKVRGILQRNGFDFQSKRVLTPPTHWLRSAPKPLYPNHKTISSGPARASSASKKRKRRGAVFDEIGNRACSNGLSKKKCYGSGAGQELVFDVDTSAACDACVKAYGKSGLHTKKRAKQLQARLAAETKASESSADV